MSDAAKDRQPWLAIETVLDRICAFLGHPWWFCHHVMGRFVHWCLDTGRLAFDAEESENGSESP